MRRAFWGVATVLACLAGGSHGTQDAVANGDTRTITIYHTHSKETLTVTFRRDGRYDPQALEQLNWLLRDWRRDEPTKMDPRLFDIIWQVYREVGAADAIHVVSAYRAPETNSMLRRRSRAVAEHSQHMLGKAMDFYLPDVPVDRIRGIGMRLQQGGVGYYPHAYTPFIHLDAGSVRAWPRMTRDQLARLFPDGRTVHIPADGTPMPGYEVAKAEVLARGGTVSGERAVAEAEDGSINTGRRRSLWATLFGGGEDEDTDFYRGSGAATGAGARGRVAARAVAPAVAAYAPAGYASSSNSEDGGSRGFFSAAAPAARAPESTAPTRRFGATQTAGLAAPAEAPVAAAPPRADERTRVAALEPPPVQRLQWQQGPGSQPGTALDDEREDPRAALVPMPPRRPGEDAGPGLSEPVAFSGMPLPPARPAFAGAVEAPSGLAEAAAASPGSLPGAIPAPPLPPRRVALASLDPSPPLPRVMATGSVNDDKSALRSLFAVAASDSAPKPQAPVKIAATRARPQAPAAASGGAMVPTGPTLNLGFSKAPTGDLTSTAFTGPAVKPLPVLR